MEKLGKSEIAGLLKELNGWNLENDSIIKNWRFHDFRESLHFINRVGELAEQFNHHPEIMNIYNRVSIRLNTHDAGGLTNLDFLLAAKIDDI